MTTCADGYNILRRFLLGKRDVRGEQNGQSSSELSKDAQAR